jgi:hypothetical protein
VERQVRWDKAVQSWVGHNAVERGSYIVWYVRCDVSMLRGNERMSNRLLDLGILSSSTLCYYGYCRLVWRLYCALEGIWL